MRAMILDYSFEMSRHSGTWRAYSFKLGTQNGWFFLPSYIWILNIEVVVNKLFLSTNQEYALFIRRQFEWHSAVTEPPNMKRNNVKNERILATLPVIMFYEFPDGIDAQYASPIGDTYTCKKLKLRNITFTYLLLAFIAINAQIIGVPGRNNMLFCYWKLCEQSGTSYLPHLHRTDYYKSLS